MTRRTRFRAAGVLAATVATAAILAAPALAAVGLEGVGGEIINPDGTPATQAASHPAEASVRFSVKTRTNEIGQLLPGEAIKDTAVELPAGLVGNPTAVPQCLEAELRGVANGGSGANSDCPVNTQVGSAVIYTTDSGTATEPGTNTVAVYNLAPPPGVAAAFGFNSGGLLVVHMFAHVRSDGDYGVTINSEVPQDVPVSGATVTLWGVPAAGEHDAERDRSCYRHEGEPEVCNGGGVAAGIPVRPFITTPTNCSAGPLTTTFRANSWENPGSFEERAFDHDFNGNPMQVEGCGLVPFEPRTTVEPTSSRADSPTGLEVEVSIPQVENPNGLAQGYVKRAVVSLPAGMAVNPSAAAGLEGCSTAQLAQETAGSAPGAGCPNASKLGTVEVRTPLLSEPLAGSIFLAAPTNNPFGSLLALYLVVKAPERGVVVKLSGKVEANPETGRLTAEFADNPQLPFESLHASFFAGSQAALITPSSCGSYTASTELSPWSAADPERPTAAEIVDSATTFRITSGPDGGPCPDGPFGPQLSAGTANPLAGRYSPFVLNLSREDGTQRLGSLAVSLPQGLLGKLAGIPYCPDSALASVSGAEGTGAAQIASPSCPAASQVGTASVGAGAGPDPFYVTAGKAYLAGPYKGAPLSLAVVTPAVAGPFDLGSVVVRNALQVDPLTAQITAVSDPLPTILHGIPLDLRDIRVEIDRPGLTLNPTSCDPMAITSTITSTEGRSATPSSRFQVGSCEALPFRPKLKLRLKGATGRIGHPALKAVLTAGPGEANIGRAQVNLPHGEFLDQGNLNKTCTRPVLLAGNCPESSVYGRARAWTPLLDKPLEGPVYLVGGYGYKLPALVADLDGQIRILLVGKVDSGKNKGIRNTFELVPDAPVSRFVLEMKGGKKYGLLENSENLCKAKKARRRAIARFTGQNGKVEQFKPVVANQCGKKAKKKDKGHHRKGR